jgi:hypothetical protein
VEGVEAAPFENICGKDRFRSLLVVIAHVLLILIVQSATRGWRPEQAAMFLDETFDAHIAHVIMFDTVFNSLDCRTLWG